MSLDLPLKYVPREQLFVDAKGKVVCHMFARQEDGYGKTDERARELEKVINRIDDQPVSVPVNPLPSDPRPTLATAVKVEATKVDGRKTRWYK